MAAAIVTIANVNEAPTDIVFTQSTALAEGVVGTFGTLNTSDPDGAGQTFTYTLMGATSTVRLDGTDRPIASGRAQPFLFLEFADF